MRQRHILRVIGLALLLAALGQPAFAQPRARAVVWSSPESRDFKASLTQEAWRSRSRFVPEAQATEGMRRMAESCSVNIRSFGRVVAMRCYARTEQNGQRGFEVTEHVRMREPPNPSVTADATSLQARAAFQQTTRLLSQRFVLDRLQPAELQRQAVQGVLRSAPGDTIYAYRTAMASATASAGDKYTRYRSPDEKRADDQRIRGIGAGVGVTLESARGVVLVGKTFTGAPAHGVLRPGDRIVMINGQRVRSTEEAMQQIRGPLGGQVSVRVVRDGSPHDFALTREEYRINPVEHRLAERGIGVVKLSKFSEGAANDVLRAVGALSRQHGRPLNGLVLDLRGNGGGRVGEAHQLLNYFVSTGELFRLTGTTDSASNVYHAKGLRGAPLRRMPLTVLVDRGSASASEIVAGVLSNTGRAKLVGEKTFGKGIGQTPFTLADGSGLRVTTSRVEFPSKQAPSGRVAYHGQGIAPHVAAPAAALRGGRGTTAAETGDDAALATALRLLSEAPATAVASRPGSSSAPRRAP